MTAGKRQNIQSSAPWEPLVGYSRAVRVGDHVFVSGSAAISDDGELVGEGDAYAQASRCIDVIRQSLGEAGADMRHVVRTRIYVTDISRWEEIARAHHEGFGAAPPATAMVEVSKLIDPRMLVEIEATALIHDQQ